jgi:hypothetical protein
MPVLDPRAHLRSVTERNQRLLVNDLKAIPADKQNASPGGAARPALHIVAECAAVNGMVAGWLSTGQRTPRGTAEENDAHFRSFDTEEKALAYLDQETNRLLAAIDALDPDTLGDTSDEPLGRPMSRFAVAELPAMHMMYHDGQLTYLQTLHGDTQNHWVANS